MTVRTSYVRGNRVIQTQGTTTTHYALDVAIGLPEVLYTSEGNTYLHLPGIIVAESNSGDTRFLLSDGLGSVRHAADDSGAVVSYHEFDPYGNPIVNYPLSTIHSPYGYTGEWWEDEVGLLYLRARWYQPETGTFLSRDAVENEPPYQYVRGNVVNLTDPSGMDPCTDNDPSTICHTQPIGGQTPQFPSLPIATPLSNLSPGSSPPIPPQLLPDCEEEKPCQVILGANRVSRIGGLAELSSQWLNFAPPEQLLPYHHYILVVDPNNLVRPGGPSLVKPFGGEISIGNFVQASDQVAVYHFGAFAEVLVNGSYEPLFLGHMIPETGFYQQSKDAVTPDNVGTLRPQYTLLDDQAKCTDVLQCFRNAARIMAAMNLNYNAFNQNSNFFTKTLLGHCGFGQVGPVNNVFAPGWNHATGYLGTQH